ncbi:ORC1 [[Candida] subhashii]|uniref:Origin recognition complex subunit 1 n=1 Tax=[Candida] subhashii TaxID=561895 RepID=A0A8J5QII9_9ASCO|nr:ORC1 [[Candida] subhashii]KAG7661403.1 ORC1 [[Candida] subhashii]
MYFFQPRFISDYDVTTSIHKQVKEMAKKQKDLAGWQYILAAESTPGATEAQTPTRRISRRGAPSADQIILKRDSDEMEIKVGDTILVNQQGETANDVALIKEIKFGTDNFIDLIVLWFTSEIDLNNDNSKKITTEKNEIYLTPYLDEIQLSEIVFKVNVLSEAEYCDIVIDDSNSSNTFMVRRTYNDESDKVSETFDFREVMNAFKKDINGLVIYVRNKAVDPAYKQTKSNAHERLQELKKKPTKPKLVSNIPTSDNDNEDDDEDEDEDEEEQYESSQNESEPEVDSSDDENGFESAEEEFGTRRKRTKSTKSPKKPTKSRRKSRIPLSSPSSSPRKKNKDIEDIYSTVLFTPKKKPKSSNIPTLLSSPAKVPTHQKALTDPTSAAFKEIKAKLHTSQKLNALPGREDEYAMIYMNLESAVNEETGCCVYVSGVPGMGKTATIRDVIEQMTQSFLLGEIKPFDYLELNGLKLLSPNIAYEMLWEKISGDKVNPAHAALLLEEYFNREDKKRKPLVVLMDELDQIAAKKQNVMYNFFNWPTYKNSRLIVIAVANTMDLPERVLSNKISSRLGLRRIQFRGYTFDQLGEIIKHRLDLLTKHSKRKVSINPDAIGFASRKVASVSGDARRALTICRRAVEIAEKQYLEDPDRNEKNGNEDDEDQPYHVLISHISMAINEIVNSPLAQYLTSLPFASKLILVGMLRRSKMSGLAENKLGEVIDEMKNTLFKTTFDETYQILSSIDPNLNISRLLYADGVFGSSKHKASLRIDHFKQALASLAEAGIIIQQNVPSERYRTVQLNISEDEAISILKRDKEVAYMLD